MQTFKYYYYGEKGTMKMELRKFCHGCKTTRKMNSIYIGDKLSIDDELSHFECDECGKRNEVGER